MIPAGGAVYAEDSGSGGGSGGGGGVSNITGITILNPPKLFYYVGESLHLGPFGDDDEDGLFVKLEFAQGDPEYVPYSGFESWGITTDPANGTELTADHDGKHIKVTVNDLEVFTEAPLIVTSVQEGAALDPETASFDKNPANQEDVRVEVNWLENALELIKINYGENYFVSDEHYDFSTDDSSGKYYLTLKKELLDLLPVGQETFTLKFSRYISVELKVNIIDTTDPVLPPWPEGSTLTASSVTSESACLSWTAASEDYGVTEYKIYQNDTLIQTVDGKATACEITGLSPKTEYTFRVEAGNGSGQWTTDGPTVTVTTLSPPISNPPTWPEGSTLTVSSATYDTVNLSWTPAVASVDQNGRIQALTEGIALITAKTADKNIRQTIHVTVTAAAPINPGNGGGGGGGNTPTTPAYNADVKAGSGSESILPVTVNKDSGSASINISAQSGLVSDGTVITIPSIPGVDTYSVGIPVADLSTADGQGTLTLNTDAGSITVPSNMLTGVKGISGSKAEISIGKGNKSNLPENVRDAIGDKPLIRLTLSIDGRQTDWSNPNAPVTVSIPYTPTAAELANPESIVIWYIDGSGNVITMPNGRFEPVTGTVTFNTTHFSDYAVAYNKVSFNDVPAGAWYAPAVSFIAAREITTGTGNGKYSPDAQLSRGEFIVLMMRAYGIAPDTSPADNFSDAGNTYYTGYLAAAKRLGITAGAGNNMYAPSKEITRQEMFLLVALAGDIAGVRL